MHMWKTLALVGTLSVAALGCKKDDSKGLPAATEWNSPTAPGEGAPQMNPGMGGMGNPHGMENPHGMDNPHGMEMGSGSIAEASGMQAPDPNRPVDASQFLRGTITVTPAAAKSIGQNASLFLSVKPYDPATKGPARMPPLAVDKMESVVLPAPFDLGEKQAMVDGTRFVGDVVVTAHVSHTGDAMTRARGDVVGMVRATIPADKLQLVLDTVIE
jgi:hypothetical protein